MKNNELLYALETHLYSLALSNFSKNQIDPITAYLVMESVSKKFLEQAVQQIMLAHMSIKQPEESGVSKGSAQELKKAFEERKETHDYQIPLT